MSQSVNANRGTPQGNRHAPYQLNTSNDGDYGSRPTRGPQGQQGRPSRYDEYGAPVHQKKCNQGTSQRLRRQNKQLKVANAALENDYIVLRTELSHEIAHYAERLKRSEDEKKLELSRLKKEVEYHKRLRQGADSHSLELAEKVTQLQQQQLQSSAAAASSAGQQQQHEFDSSLVEQSLLLTSKNADIMHKLGMVGLLYGLLSGCQPASTQRNSYPLLPSSLSSSPSSSYRPTLRCSSCWSSNRAWKLSWRRCTKTGISWLARWSRYRRMKGVT